MKKPNREREGLIVVALTCLGVMLLLIGARTSNVELGFFSFTMGVGVSCFAVGLAFSMVLSVEKEFTKNKKGALWIWAVCLLSIVVLAMGWFTLTWPTFMIIDYIESIYTFPPEATNAITLVKTVMGWFLILMALGLLLWAYVNSQRREEVTYPVG